VLGRTFAQMAGLEGEFVRREMPYRVVGKAAFLERREVTGLLDYVRVARRYGLPLDDDTAESLSHVANVPNRRIPADDVRQATTLVVRRSGTTRDALSILADDRLSGLPAETRRRVDALSQRLERLGELLRRDDMRADEVFKWLMNAVDYRAHFRDYFGRGEDSEERLETLDAFLAFARKSEKAVLPRRSRGYERSDLRGARGGTDRLHHDPPDEGARVRPRLHSVVCGRHDADSR
jgi:DNA helicase II / ATP-dependent DNA helicase PcrA